MPTLSCSSSPEETPGYKLYKLWEGDRRDRWAAQSEPWRQRWEEMAKKVKKLPVDFQAARPNLKIADPLDHAAKAGGFTISSKGPGTVATPAYAAAEAQTCVARKVGTKHQDDTQKVRDTIWADAPESPPFPLQDLNSVISGSTKTPITGGLLTGYTVQAKDPTSDAEKVLLNKFILKALGDKKTRPLLLKAIFDALDAVEDIEAPDWMIHR